MKELEKCPKCGSTRVLINGVLQKKKSAMYYLSGEAFVNAGARHGNKIVSTLTGNKNNAECMDCRYTWRAGKEPAPASTASASCPPAPRSCRKCGAAVEPGDLFCVNCGAKL